MILTTKQMEGLKIAVQRFRNREPYTVIAGYAGTGKSTLIRFIIDALEIESEEVSYVAYTGKATLVLQDKGCPNATTAHKLLYFSKQRSDGTYYHYPRPFLENPHLKLIVVDEVSMLPQTMWDLLMRHKVHVIACGDPFQLPAIGENCTVLDNPHIFLDEIMRQAAESEIIRLSMDIRERKPLKPFEGEEIRVYRKKDMVEGMYTWADQIICATNKTRSYINNYMRSLYYGDLALEGPQPGDRIICLRNDWEFCTFDGHPLVNGMLGTLDYMELYPCEGYGTHCFIDFSPDGLPLGYIDLDIDYKFITEGKETFTKENYKRFKAGGIKPPHLFDYGYAISCHKSQGSEYDKVLLIEEWWPTNEEEHARWLYTGLTRAREKATIIMKD